MTTAEIQTRILTETGLKTSVKAYSKGSMKGYIRIMPIFQDGKYPSLPFDFAQKIKEELKAYDYAEKPLLATCSDICIYQLEDDRIHMKKESKPKVSDKLVKGWGSKNSQMRLDKATRRNAVKMNKGNTARYY